MTEFERRTQHTNPAYVNDQIALTNRGEGTCMITVSTVKLNLPRHRETNRYETMIFDPCLVANDATMDGAWTYSEADARAMHDEIVRITDKYLVQKLEGIHDRTTDRDHRTGADVGDV